MWVHAIILYISALSDSFLIPTIEILLRREEPLTLHQVGAIIISPTRYEAILSTSDLLEQIFLIEGQLYLISRFLWMNDICVLTSLLDVISCVPGFTVSRNEALCSS